jgi:hypothetical protein
MARNLPQAPEQKVFLLLFPQKKKTLPSLFRCAAQTATLTFPAFVLQVYQSEFAAGNCAATPSPAA